MCARFTPGYGERRDAGQTFYLRVADQQPHRPRSALFRAPRVLPSPRARGGDHGPDSGEEPVAAGARSRVPPHQGGPARPLGPLESRPLRLQRWRSGIASSPGSRSSSWRSRATSRTRRCTYIEALHADPLYHPELGGLIDARRITSLPASDDLLEFARLAPDGGASRRTRRAVLVDSDVARGLARMLEAYSAEGPTEYRPFRRHEDALQWLVTTEHDP